MSQILFVVIYCLTDGVILAADIFILVVDWSDDVIRVK